MTEFPTRIMERKETHSILRLASTKDYSDKSKPGDRILSVFLEQLAYEFSSYDISTKADGLGVKVPYTTLES